MRHSKLPSVTRGEREHSVPPFFEQFPRFCDYVGSNPTSRLLNQGGLVQTQSLFMVYQRYLRLSLAQQLEARLELRQTSNM